MKTKNKIFCIILLLVTAIQTSLPSDAKKRSSEKGNKDLGLIALDCNIGSGRCDLEGGHCTTIDGFEGACYTDYVSRKKKACNCYPVCDRSADVACYKRCLSKGFAQGRCKNHSICSESSSEQIGPRNSNFNCCCSIPQ